MAYEVLTLATICVSPENKHYARRVSRSQKTKHDPSYMECPELEHYRDRQQMSSCQHLGGREMGVTAKGTGFLLGVMTML